MGPPKGLVGDGKIPQPGHLAGIKKIRRRNNLEPKHQIVDQSYNKSKKSKKGGAKKGGAKKSKTSKVHKGTKGGAKKSKTAKVHKEKVCKGKTCPKGKKVGAKAKILK